MGKLGAAASAAFKAEIGRPLVGAEEVAAQPQAAAGLLDAFMVLYFGDGFWIETVINLCALPVCPPRSKVGCRPPDCPAAFLASGGRFEKSCPPAHSLAGRPDSP